MQQNLEGIYAEALINGYEVGVPTMVGAAIATVGSKVVKVVGLSGPYANGRWAHAVESREGRGRRRGLRHRVQDGDRRVDLAQGRRNPRRRQLSPGLVAAQKVLMEIIRQASPQGGSSLKITNSHGRDLLEAEREEIEV